MEQNTQQQTINTNEIQNTKPKFNFAPNDKRFLAFIVDGIIFTLLSIPVAIVIVLVIALTSAAVITPGNDSQTGFSTSVITLVTIISFVLGYVAILVISIYQNAYYPSRHNGQTWGKKYFKIKVIDEKGNAPTFGLMLLRYFLQGILAGFISFFIYITVFFDDEKRTVYDMLVNTYVVEE